MTRMSKIKKHAYQIKCIDNAADALCIAEKNLRLAFNAGGDKAEHDDYIVLLAQVKVARLQISKLISEYGCVIWV